MIRRKLKNVIKNYTECEILVREATSNEPWGPTNSILSKVAEYSNNEPNIIQIMPLIWKRLKDKGRKWRHVYKSLLLLLFLVTRGNILIAEYVRRNIHFIQSLETFTYTEDNVDVGGRIRKRAGELIVLLKDNDLLKSERQKALLTDKRFSKDVVSQGSNVPIKYGNGVGSLSQGPSTGSFISSSDNKDAVIKVDYPVPSTSVEEDIQLQIALAESKEEAERLEKTAEIEQLTDKYKMNLAIEKNLKENYFESDFECGLWQEGEAVVAENNNDPWSPEPEKKSIVGDPWSRNVASNESLWSSNDKRASADPWQSDVGKDDGCWGGSEALSPDAPWPLEDSKNMNVWPNIVQEYCTEVEATSNTAQIGYNPWSTHNSHASPTQAQANPTDLREGSVTQFLADHSHLVNFDSLLSPELQHKRKQLVTDRSTHLLSPGLDLEQRNNPFLNEASRSECLNPFLAPREPRPSTAIEAGPWGVDPRPLTHSTTCNNTLSMDLNGQCQSKQSHYNPFLT